MAQDPLINGLPPALTGTSTPLHGSLDQSKPEPRSGRRRRRCPIELSHEINQRWSRALGSNSNFNMHVCYPRSAYVFTLSSHLRHYTCLRAGPGKLLGLFSRSCRTVLIVLTLVYVCLFEQELSNHRAVHPRAVHPTFARKHLYLPLCFLA